jgi:hypothetical protein
MAATNLPSIAADAGQRQLSTRAVSTSPYHTGGGGGAGERGGLFILLLLGQRIKRIIYIIIIRPTAIIHKSCEQQPLTHILKSESPSI